MRRAKALLAAFIFIVAPAVARAQAPGIINTIAGGGPNNMPALSASLNQPTGVAADTAGNMYVVTANGHFVFKVNISGQLTILAGNGTPGFGGDGGPSSGAVLNGPNQATVDGAGNVFIADMWNHRIRRVDVSTGIISTVAGNGVWAFSGDGGPATSASLALPSGIALDAAGNLFIVDRLNNRIRRVDAATGIITTVAGNGTAGFAGDGGPATNAALNNPLGVAVDMAGNVFVADMSNNLIRRIDAATGIITTVAGNGLAGFSGDGGPAINANLNGPSDVAVSASGGLLIADVFNNRVRRVDLTKGVISTVAGDGTLLFKGDGGLATNASLSWPDSVKLDNVGNILVADSLHQRIRRIDATTGIISTSAGNGTVGLSGDNYIATDASLLYPFSLAQDRAGNLFIVDSNNYAIRKRDAGTGIVTTVAGNGVAGWAVDGAPATSSIGQPLGVAVDGMGNLFISQEQLSRIIRVDAVTGIITTVAGSKANIPGFSGDGGPAINALLNHPTCLGLDSAGNLYVCDSWNFRVRRIDAATGIITTVAGNGTQGYWGDGVPATSAILNYVYALAVDPKGNLFVGDGLNHRVRRVDALTGIITTVAGNGFLGLGVDGIPATSSSIDETWGVALDSSGNLYISERYNSRIRVVAAGTGIITTIAGTGVHGFSGDGGPSMSATFWEPSGLFVDASRNVFVCDTNNNRVRKFLIPNLPPTASAGPNQTLEATGPTTPVTLNGVGSDPDGDPLSFVWRDSSNAVVGSTAVITVNLPLGTQTFTLTVTDPSGASASASVSITVRDTTPPSVTLTSPNGGEKIFAGTPFTIQWNASDAVGISSIDVYFSINAGLSFTAVPGCTGLPGTARSCVWVAPGPTASQGRIRVTATDLANNLGSDASKANFSVVSGSASITVTQPNSALSWVIGSTHVISWNHNLGLNSYVNVELSRDAGSTWELIAAWFKNTGATSSSLNWVVTGPVTAQARVRVTWTSGPVSSISNVNFNIVNPSVTVTQPNTNVNWGVGSSQQIQWSHNLGLGTKFTIELSRDAGLNWELITASATASTATAGIYNWTVTGPATTMALVRVTWNANPAGIDVSNVTFTIASVFLNVTAPSSSTVNWGYGSLQSQNWATNLGPGDRVNVLMSTDGGTTFPLVLASNVVASARSVKITTPLLGAPTTLARVRVEWVANPVINGVNPANFKVQPPFITVTSPNGPANVWTIGSNRTITWANNLGSLEYARIELSLDGGATYPVVLSASNPCNGSRSVTVLSAWATQQGRVRITWLKDGTVSDASDQNFPIQ